MREHSKTVSECVFEQFLRANDLKFEKIAEANTRRPDYLVEVANTRIIFEIKQIEKRESGGNRIVGEHVRRKIGEARQQVRFASDQGIPSVLMVHNKDTLDQQFRFAIENVDFITAMYGEYTLGLSRDDGSVLGSFHGRNQCMREDRNVEFSAVGRLESLSGKMVITLFENVFSRVRLPYELLPACFIVNRISLDYSAARPRKRARIALGNTAV